MEINEPVKTEEVKESLLEETKKLVVEIKKEKEELVKIKEELETIRSDQILSGSSEVSAPVAVKEQTNREYALEVIAGKHNVKAN